MPIDLIPVTEAVGSAGAGGSPRVLPGDHPVGRLIDACGAPGPQRAAPAGVGA